MRMTAFCLAITCACHTRATDIRLIAQMHRASTKPVWVSEAGIAKTRRIQSMGFSLKRAQGTKQMEQSMCQVECLVLVRLLPAFYAAFHRFRFSASMPTSFGV